MTKAPDRASDTNRPEIVPELLARALAAHRAGEIPVAIDLYSEVLRLAPDQPHALHLMGEIAHRAGMNERAIELIGRAVTFLPQHAEAHNNLGTAYQALGRFAEAEAIYRRALALKPTLAVARNNLGAVLKAQRRTDEARIEFEKALAIDPRSAEARLNLGNLLRDAGDLAGAERRYREVTTGHPDNAAGWNNLGICLLGLDRAEEARVALERAIALDPRMPEAHNNLGNAFNRMGRLEEAMACYQQALALRPGYAQAENNIGMVLGARFKFQEAVPFLRQAVEHEPDFVDALLNLGAALRNLDHLSEAVHCFDRALALEPGNAKGRNYRGLTLVEMGRIEEGLRECKEALRLSPDYRRAHSNYLFSLNYRADASGAEMLAEHRAFDIPAAPRQFANTRDPDRRLRIAYVSPDFKHHSCSFFIEPLLAAHDKSAVEVFCYSDVRMQDPVTRRVKSYADHWRDTADLTDEQLAARLADDAIDIAVDLAGHTGENRLAAFARRMAPLQVAWLGYPCTTGIAAIDYRISDAVADPVGAADAHCSESLIRLPRTFLCYRPMADAPTPGPLPALGGAPFTFGSFNNLPKINDRVIDAWSEILRRVPKSRLMLKSRALRDEPTCERILAAFEQRGIDRVRLELVGWISNPAEHLKLYDRIDLALDPFPYNGTTTTCEALWMGVPVLTVVGDRHAARVGASLLGQVGLPEFITHACDAYIERAIELAAAPAALAEVRRGLRARMAASPLRDEAGFARDIETAYRAIWRDWCARS